MKTLTRIFALLKYLPINAKIETAITTNQDSIKVKSVKVITSSQSFKFNIPVCFCFRNNITM